jgi:hypothetical protein
VEHPAQPLETPVALRLLELFFLRLVAQELRQSPPLLVEAAPPALVVQALGVT